MSNDPHNPTNQKILAALADGDLDTDELIEKLRLPYSTISNNLTALRVAGRIEGLGRRKKYRKWGSGYVMIWRLTRQVVKRETPAGDFRVAGRIVHGRGSRWGAGLV